MSENKNLASWIEQYPREIPDGVQLSLLADQPIYNKYSNVIGGKKFVEAGLAVRFSKEYIEEEFWKDTDWGDLVKMGIGAAFGGVQNYVSAWFLSLIVDNVGFPFPDKEFDYSKMFADRQSDGSLQLYFFPHYFGTENYGYDPTVLYPFIVKGRFAEAYAGYGDDARSAFPKQFVDDLIDIDNKLATLSSERAFIIHEILKSWHFGTMTTLIETAYRKKVPLFNGTGKCKWDTSIESNSPYPYSGAASKYSQKTLTGFTGKFTVFFKTVGAPFKTPIGTLTYFGHVGWGFEKPRLTQGGDDVEKTATLFVGGSTEQFSGDTFTRSAGEPWSAEYNPIGAWHSDFETAELMFDCFKKESNPALSWDVLDPNGKDPGGMIAKLKEAGTKYRDIMGDYDLMYTVTVENANPAAAELTAGIIEQYSHYKALGGSNCLDHTILMMKMYGIDPAIIPSASDLGKWKPAEWVQALNKEIFRRTPL